MGDNIVWGSIAFLYYLLCSADGGDNIVWGS